MTPRVDAEYRRWLQRNATSSVLIYSGLIAVLMPGFHFVLAALPGVPPGSDSMGLRCIPAVFSLLLAGSLLLVPGLRRYAVTLQLFNVLVVLLTIVILVINSGNHYAYIAAGLLVIVGAQQAFYRTSDLAITFVAGFFAHIVYSALHGILWDPMNLAALGTFGSGYLVGFIPAALRIKIQNSEIRNRLAAQRVKEELLEVHSITRLGNLSRDLLTGATEWSAELYAILDVPPDTDPAELPGLFQSCIHPDDFPEFDRCRALCKITRESFTLDHRVIGRGGATHWVELHGKYEYDADGNPVHWVAAALDITARKRAEEALVRLARYDELTGLPNRTTIRKLLAASIDCAAREGSQCAVAFVDLDRFKDINDTLGHEVGDRMLQDVSGRISAVLGEAGVLGRWGGDEFVVIAPAADGPGAIEELAQHVVHTLAEPFRIDGVDLAISASVGIAIGPQDGADASVLIRNADTAMYKAKQELGSGYAFFSDALHTAAANRRYVSSELRRAITEGNLELYYQPIVDAVSRRVVAAEALLRWIDNGRVRLPGEFIAIAEDSRIIIPLGAWVLEAACEQSARWERSGLDIRVAVNVSPRQFAHPDFVETLDRALQRSGANPANLEIEITEAAIMSNVEPVLATLQAIHRTGIRVAIDDFGTGYSSFAYLKRFNVDSLKIDRTFVEGIEREDNLAIARSIISVAHALGLPVTAEGVESPLQGHVLTGLGCDRLQGFHFGRPVPVNDFESGLRDAAGGLSLKA